MVARAAYRVAAYLFVAFCFAPLIAFALVLLVGIAGLLLLGRDN